MLALNRLRICFANCMKHRVDVPLIRIPTIGVKLRDAKGFQQGFQFEECFILMVG